MPSLVVGRQGARGDKVIGSLTHGNLSMMPGGGREEYVNSLLQGGSPPLGGAASSSAAQQGSEEIVAKTPATPKAPSPSSVGGHSPLEAGVAFPGNPRFGQEVLAGVDVDAGDDVDGVARGGGSARGGRRAERAEVRAEGAERATMILDDTIEEDSATQKRGRRGAKAHGRARVEGKER